MKRYNLALPDDMYDELNNAAESRGQNIVDLLRQFIRLGLLLLKFEKDNPEIIVKTNDGKERLIVFH